MSTQRIIITFLMLIYILTSLSLTLRLTKFYFKTKRNLLFVVFLLLTLFSTFFYFFTAVYVMRPLINVIPSMIISIILFLSVTWTVYSLDSYNVKLKNSIKEIDKTLIDSNKEISSIRKRVTDINVGFEKDRKED